MSSSRKPTQTLRQAATVTHCSGWRAICAIGPRGAHQPRCSRRRLKMAACISAAGSRIEFGDGSDKTYRIVGEDEANPAEGTISYVSPLAQNMMGKDLGDDVTAGTRGADIVGIG